MDYKICTFNIQNFNSTKKSVNRPKNDRPRLIAEMIRRNDMDIIAIQEIVRKEAFYNLLNRLKDRWDGRFEYSGTAGEGGEGYGFIWKKRRLSLVEGEGLLNPQIINNDNSSYLRPPFYIRLKPEGCKIDFELRLLAIHVRFSNNKRFSEEEDDIIHPQDEGTLDARRREIDQLIKKYEEINVPSSENNYAKVAYTILLGDYNLCIKGSPLLSPPGSDRACKIINENSENMIILKTTGEYKTTLKMIPKNIKPYFDKGLSVPISLQSNGIDKWAHNYDHFTYNINQMGDAKYLGEGRPSISDLGISPSWKQVYDYRAQYSDHIPLLYSFDLSRKKVTIEDIK